MHYHLTVRTAPNFSIIAPPSHNTVGMLPLDTADPDMLGEDQAPLDGSSLFCGFRRYARPAAFTRGDSGPSHDVMIELAARDKILSDLLYPAKVILVVF